MEKEKDLDLGNIGSITIDNDQFKDCLSEVSRIDDFRDYLKETMSADIKRYFYASKEQQDAIRGAFQRTKYFYDLLKKISDDNLKKQ